MNAFKEKRILSSMSRKKASSMIGVSANTITRWEDGKSKPRIGLIGKIAEVYGCEIKDFLKEFES